MCRACSNREGVYTLAGGELQMLKMRPRFVTVLALFKPVAPRPPRTVFMMNYGANQDE